MDVTSDCYSENRFLQASDDVRFQHQCFEHFSVQSVAVLRFERWLFALIAFEAHVRSSEQFLADASVWSL